MSEFISVIIPCRNEEKFIAGCLGKRGDTLTISMRSAVFWLK